MMRRRGGPGLLSTMARTAVISGTATATANRMNARAAAGAAAQQGSEAPVAAGRNPGATDGVAGAAAEVAALGEPGAMIAQLQQLGKLKESGLLTDEEFSAAKARLLASLSVSGDSEGR